MGEQAAFRVKQAVALGNIVEQEALEVSKDEVESWLDDRAEERSQSRSEIDQLYGYPDNLDRLTETVKRERVLEKVLDASSGKKIKPKPEKVTAKEEK